MTLQDEDQSLTDSVMRCRKQMDAEVLKKKVEETAPPKDSEQANTESTDQDVTEN